MESREKFIITDEMIRGASDYIPFDEKRTIAEDQAPACLVAVDKGTDEIATETQLPIPQLFKERSGAKQYFLMYYFLTKYLHVKIAETGWTTEEYDYYASSHIFNQLERFKSKDAEIKNKVFDLLYDYKQLKSMLEVEIYNLKEAKNSALDRLQDSIALFSTPENVAKLNELMQKNLGELEAAQKKLAEKRGEAHTEEKQEEEKPTEEKPAEA